MEKKNLTLLSCSYNTPVITETMLKSFVESCGRDYPVLIIENSTNDETAKILDANNVPYIKNPGGTHSPSVDIAFENCKTDYALLVDTDIIFKPGVPQLLDILIKSGVAVAGTECGSRAGHNLYPRVHPWFMFVDVKQIKKHGIKFHDESRIKASHADGFYLNTPVSIVEPHIKKYDVGATFYEDVKRAGLKIYHCPQAGEFYYHYEGSSWMGHTPGWKEKYDRTMLVYDKVIELFKDVQIKL